MEGRIVSRRESHSHAEMKGPPDRAPSLPQIQRAPLCPIRSLFGEHLEPSTLASLQSVLYAVTELAAAVGACDLVDVPWRLFDGVTLQGLYSRTVRGEDITLDGGPDFFTMRKSITRTLSCPLEPKLTSRQDHPFVHRDVASTQG